MEEIIKKYLDEVINLNTESAVSQRFSALINELFKSQLDFINDYFSGIETPFTIEKDDRCIRGRADNLFGNVIIEFKKTLPKNPADAKDKLPKYVYILWSREEFDARKPYLCITTDGKRFIVYSALLQDRQKIDITIDDVRLEIIDDVNWLELEDLSTAYYWLDRYFLRQEIRIPTSDTIAKDFGIESHALKTISNSLMSLWRKIREKNEYSVIINNWEKYLKIVYGNFTADEELFINHTYLATLAKLLIWSRISKEKTLPDEEQILEILEGKYFKKQGIENLIEEDFFSWLIRSEAKKAAFDSVKWLFSLLKDFDLNKLSEDVLKSLYQELVEPKSRHYLGEFYTPDWLANRIVDKFMNENPEGSFLDPSCGSGTFIYFTILEKIKRLGSSAETLNKIMDSVCGADIHPLAVIIAKTNYILALGDLLADRVRTFNIPIYLADTIKLPKMWAERTNSDYEIDINGVTAYLPVIFTQDYELGDKAIEAAKEYALRSKGLEMKYKDFKKFMENKALPVHDDHDYSQPLFTIADAFKVSIDKDEDSIWAFVLKNI
ncbi:MAG: SAM-dependent DNA methyltransferase [FCB group bacterium]|nr:SAM-dependent DNA methyltransferase [FCB group bacterium]